MKPLVALVALVLPGLALAQPKFEFGKKEEVKGVEWKASAGLNFIFASGNSNVTTFSTAGAVSRKADKNKLSLEAGAAYARSEIVLASDTDGEPGIGASEISAIEQTTTKMWTVKGRYDRFFTEKNSAYATAKGTSDKPAGNELLVSGQIGYSRLIFKNPKHELAGELGYDFSWQDYVVAGDAVAIHSGRLFLGYKGALTATTGAEGSVEWLANVNEESTPLGAVGPFEDNRVVAKAAISTNLRKKISLKVSLTEKYDSDPAPRPQIGGAAWEAGYQPRADKLDQIVEVGLIFTLL